jgi:hypothetical protein
MTKKVSKIFLYVLLSVIALSVVLIGYTQTGVFRSNLRSFLYNTVQSNLNATVYFGEIEGNLFSGFSIDTLMIYVDHKPFVESGKILITYNLLDGLNNTIHVRTLTIEHPKVYLTRRKDGSWNVDHLSRSTAPPDSLPSKIFIDARKIFLRNATFAMVDSTGEMYSSIVIDGRKSVNYSNLFVRNINLDFSGMYSSKGLSASIEKLSFELPREKFTLNNLSADILYTKDSARVSNLTIETPNSHLALNAHMSGVDVFSIKDIKALEDCPTDASISSSNVAAQDLQTFLPVLYFIKGSVLVDASIQGIFSRLTIKKLDASFANTSLHVTGTVSDLHTPKDLRLDVVSKQSTITPTDAPELLPYFHIPNYPELGMLTMDFQFVGKPLDFMVVSTLKSSAGDIAVDGEMLITESDLHYKGMLTGRNVHLEKIFSVSQLATQLNVKTYIEGKGTSIDRLDAVATIEIDSSLLNGVPVSSASLALKAKEKKINSTLTIDSPEGNIRSSVDMDFNKAVPAYNLSAAVRQLNLAPIVKDDYYATRLSFDVTRSASGFDFLDGDAETKIQLFPSTFRSYTTDSSKIFASIKTDSSSRRTITVESPIADGKISGFFTFNGFLHAINSSVKQFNNMYAYQRRVTDSSYIAEKDSVLTVPTDAVVHKMDYDITVKNLRPIAVVFRLPSFDATGHISGHLEGNDKRALLSGAMDLKKIFFAQDSTMVQGRNIVLDYNIANADSLATNSTLPVNVDLHSHIEDLMINNTIFKQSDVALQISDTSGAIRVFADVDTTMSFGVEGKIGILPHSEHFDLSKLKVMYQGYELENASNVAFRLSPDGCAVDSSLFVHRNQQLALSGNYHFNGMIDGTASIRKFNLPDIHYFSTSENFRESTADLDGLVDADVKLRGTVADPRFTIVIHGDSLSYKHSLIGTLSGLIRYADRNADVDVRLSNNSDTALSHSAMVKGKIPVDLRFQNVPDRTSLDGLNVQLTSSNLNMSALDPFIPELKNMEGTIQSDIAVSGSLKNPAMKGSAHLINGLFVFETNGLQYTAHGTIILDSNKISLADFKIQNIPSDFNDGGIMVGGYILMKGFAPEEYHLTANGELLALSSHSRSAGSYFFGTLPVSTGKESLHFDGTFDRSRVSGIVYVADASLIFPPTQQTSSYSGSGTGSVQFVDDTSKVVVDTVKEDIFLPVGKIVSGPKTLERTFLDGFGYTLTIQTEGPMTIDMIFNPNAGAYEELKAFLNGKLILTKNENGTQLTGTIEVGGESYYSFYKNFNATGSLTFVGDPENPQLNIVATYEGTHRPDEMNTTKDEKAIVTLTITGTRIAPKISIGLKTVDASGKETERTGDVENDAIAFLLTSAPGTPGKFRDELTADDRTKIGNQLASAFTGSFINSMLSGAVMEFVQKNKIPFIKSFQVRDVGTDPAKTDIRLGGEFLDATVNLGGRVFSDINNTNVSIQYPIGDKVKRNFMIEVEKKTEDYDFTVQTRTTLGARIFYRFTF